MSVSPPPSSPPRSSSAFSSISSSLPPPSTSSGSLWRFDSSPVGAAAGDGRDGTRRVDADGFRLVLRFAVRALLAAPRLAAPLAAPRFAAPLREAAVLRALLRDAPAREPAARLVFRAALLLRLAAALRLRLAFAFFLPRGGILLLRELGSPSSRGRSKFAARADLIRYQVSLSGISRSGPDRIRE